MCLRRVIGYGVLLLCTISVAGQSTEFTYQGRLTDGSLPATGVYDFEFRLFSVETGGSAIATVSRPGVSVTTGIFSVRLDFAANFDGTARWIEIALKTTAAPTFTNLAPRQPITSTPYAIRSLNSESADTAVNASQLGGVAANQYVVTTDPRMTDARMPVAGNANYIQNTAVQQASSSFNVSGSGVVGGTLTANVVTSATQFNIGVSRALALGTSTSIFAGRNAGISNTTGSGNSFFGDGAGRFNTGASNNSFVGRDAGTLNTASDNSFFGAFAGDSNTTGTRNSFFGVTSGDSNQVGNDNAFFGYRAGRLNTADGNSFFGSQSGDSITTGSNNAFFGYSAGSTATTASDNSFFGYQAGAVNTIDGSSFFGAFAGDSNTTGANNSFFGNSAGTANVTGADNSFFGFHAGRLNTAGNNSFFGSHAGDSNTIATRNSFFGSMAGQGVVLGNDNSFFGALAGANSTSSNNSFFGSFAGHFNTQGNDNAFFGTGSGYNNSLGNFNSFFGSRAGEFTSTSNDNSFFGYNAGNANDGSGNTFVGRSAGVSNTDGDNNTFVGKHAGSTTTIGSNNTALGAVSGLGADNLQYATAIGAGSVVSTSNTIVLGRLTGADRVRIHGLGIAGSIGLCLNNNDEISTCSSSLRYKENVRPFFGGLNITRRLRPVSFAWIEGGENDVGFVAEEVNKVEPLLTTRNAVGEIEGVKYSHVTTVLVNAINEQQLQIELQSKKIAELTRIVCELKPAATICKERP